MFFLPDNAASRDHILLKYHDNLPVEEKWLANEKATSY